MSLSIQSTCQDNYTHVYFSVYLCLRTDDDEDQVQRLMITYVILDEEKNKDTYVCLSDPMSDLMEQTKVQWICSS